MLLLFVKYSRRLNFIDTIYVVIGKIIITGQNQSWKNMKKLAIVISTLLLVVAFTSCEVQNGIDKKDTESQTKSETYKIAMVTDCSDVNDMAYDQATYEACKNYAMTNGLKFMYYKPAADTDTDRTAAIENAIEDGFNILVLPGYFFGTSIASVAPEHPEVKFIGLDVIEEDVGKSFPNVYCISYRDDIAGFLAGYAAIALGYSNLCVCGGMPIPSVVNYTYGFVQGADAAAAKLGKTGTIQYIYANQHFPDKDITAAMDTVYANGAEVVFACGGGIYFSVAEAAAKVGKKVVGVDVDQKAEIDGIYGEGITLTSAMKGLYASTQYALKTIVEDDAWGTIAGTFSTLGIISGTDMDSNFVGIPTESGTEWSSSFTLEDYKALVNDIYTGKIVVSVDTTKKPEDNAKVLTVNYLGKIKPDR